MGWSCFSTCSGPSGLPRLTQAHHGSHQHYRFLQIPPHTLFHCPYLSCCGITLPCSWQNYSVSAEPCSLSSAGDVGRSESLLYNTEANGSSHWALSAFYYTLLPFLFSAHPTVLLAHLKHSFPSGIPNGK